MLLINPIRISYKNLLAAKWRSFLTMLGIIIGVSAVIVIMSIGQSAQSLILEQVAGIGSNLIGVLPGGGEEEGPPAALLGISVTTLKYDDLEALRDKKNVPEVEAAAGYVLGTATAEYGGTSQNVSFTGTTASYLDVESGEMETGRFFSKDEEINLSRVAVLGSSVSEDLFGTADPINKVIKIKGHSFNVVGVLKERGTAAFGLTSQDDNVFVPLKTAQKLLLGIDHLGFVRLKAESEELVDSAIANIKLTLREQHDIDDPINDDFTVRSQAVALDVIKGITDVLRYFLLTIGTISLAVGGVGIMNIMLIAVNQRIREIGLRKAVGARNSDVLLQFLVESIAISFAGGMIGIIFGLLVSYLISVVVQSLGYSWPFLVSAQSIFVATLVSISIGVIFGSYPARKASKTSPMEALRYE